MRNPTHGSDASIAVGSVAIATLAWRHQGVLRLTAIAKASFAFAVDGPLSRVEPEPIVVEEVHHDRNPMKSTWRTPDLVPYLRRADVLLTGTAFVTPGGDGAIRLGIFDGNAARLHKTALLRPASGAAQVPLRAEHAYGGQGFADNPLGTGRSSAPPSLVDAGDPQRAALFGPLGQFPGSGKA